MDFTGTYFSLLNTKKVLSHWWSMKLTVLEHGVMSLEEPSPRLVT